MKNIGIYVNPMKDKQGTILNHALKSIKEFFSESSIYIIKTDYGIIKLPKTLDVIIVFGGDGTILGVSREILPKIDVPILGVNIGNLGFLTNVELKELNFALKKLKEGNFKIVDRMMLECSVFNGIEEYRNDALNDIVVSRGTLSRIAKFDIYVNDEYYDNFKGDGIIISTPVGSTAYSFSAGGPLIHPSLQTICITPICPHSPNMRPMILPGNFFIEIKSDINVDELYVTVDGQKSIKLFNTYTLKVSKSSTKCRLIQLEDFNYYNVLRKKILNKN